MFFQADPKQQWAVLSTKEDQSAISTEFIQTMCDLSHNVRMYASQAVSRYVLKKRDKRYQRDSQTHRLKIN